MHRRRGPAVSTGRFDRAGGARRNRGTLDHAARRSLGIAQRGLSSAGELAPHPDRLGGMVRSMFGFSKALVHEATSFDKRRSPLWTARSLGRTLRLLRVPLEEVRQVAKSHGGVDQRPVRAGAAGGAGAYHRACGLPSTSCGWRCRSTPAPTGPKRATRSAWPACSSRPGRTPRALGAVHERLSGVRGSASVSSARPLAGPANLLPAALLVRTARSQVSSVDFTIIERAGRAFPSTSPGPGSSRTTRSGRWWVRRSTSRRSATTAASTWDCT